MKLTAIESQSGNKIQVKDAYSNTHYWCDHYKQFEIDVKLFKVIRGETEFFRYPPNFEHDPRILAELDFKHKTGDESALHFNTKMNIATMLEKQKKDVEIEKIFKNEHIHRVADVFCRYKDNQQVYEIQISNLTLEDLKNRTEDYESFGIDDVIWILDSGLSNLDKISDWLFVRGYKYGILEVSVEKKEIAAMVI